MSLEMNLGHNAHSVRTKVVFTNLAIYNLKNDLLSENIQPLKMSKFLCKISAIGRFFKSMSKLAGRASSYLQIPYTAGYFSYRFLYSFLC